METLDPTQPIYVHKSYWPASVLLPNKTVLHRCRVFVTNQGLAVFSSPAEDPEFFSAMDWGQTVEPRAPRNHVGIDLFTVAGLVVVTKTGGCTGCGSRMGAWQPSWASMVQAWPERTHEPASTREASLPGGDEGGPQ